MMDIIEIWHLPTVQEGDLEDLESCLSELGADVAITRYEPGPQASAEWALPAILMLLLGKPFLDGFMGELGVGLATRLKRSVSGLYRKMRGKEVVWASKEILDAASELSETENQYLRSHGKSSCFLDIQVDLSDLGTRARRISFKIPMGLSDQELLSALERLPEVARTIVTSMEEQSVDPPEGNHLAVGITTFCFFEKRWVDLRSILPPNLATERVGKNKVRQ